MRLGRWLPIAIVLGALGLGGWLYAQRETDPYLLGYRAAEARDYATAHRLWTLAAGQGDTRSMMDLARAYSAGEGVPVNLPVAAEWLRKAAVIDKSSKFRRGIAATILGDVYSEGRPGIPKNLPEAFRQYRDAAEAMVNSRAQVALGKMYLTGQGTAINYPEALKWFQVAGSSDEEAMRMIGFINERGIGVAQNYVEAAKWYRTSAERSSPLAHLALAGLYETGRGVPLSLIEAHKNYNLAAILSYSVADKEGRITRNVDVENALSGRDRVAKKMSADQISQGRQQVWDILPLELRRYLD